MDAHTTSERATTRRRRPLRRATVLAVAAALAAGAAVTATPAPTGAAPTATATPLAAQEPSPAAGADPDVPDDDMAWDDTPPPPDTAPAPPAVDTPELEPTPRSAAQASVAGQTVRTINPNGGWCWWQTPRVEITSDGELLAASTPSTQGSNKRGQATDLATVDLATGDTGISTLMSGRLKSDDHNSGAVLELPSGRVVTAWAGHSQEPYMHVAWRDQGSATWILGTPVHRPESADSIPTGGGFGSRAMVTYANLVWVQQDNGGRGRLYNFFRGRGDQPYVMWSDDEGVTWRDGGQVFARAQSRPYAHYAAAPDGKVWFTVGRGHPHAAYQNPVYSGYVLGGKMHRSDGTFVTNLGNPVDPSQFTLVFQSTVTRPPAELTWLPESYRGLNDTDAWGSDLQVDATGAPVMTFSVRKPERSPVAGKMFVQDYFWARLDTATSQWKVVRMGGAGSELYDQQPSYTGLASLDPTDPYRVFASTNVNPVSGAPLVSSADGRAHHEIWEATSTDQGSTWTWAPVTRNSSTDNLRPTLAAANGSWALLWLKGRYTNFVDNYAQSVVGIVLPGSPPATSALLARRSLGPSSAPVVGDFSGDGADDVLAYRPGTATDILAITSADGRRHSRYQTVTVNGTYTSAAGDIDVNGVDDIVWYAPASGVTTSWMFQPGAWYRSVTIGTGPKGAQIRMGDFDGNGTADILFYKQYETQIWLSKRAGGWDRLWVPVSDAAYRPIVGDFTGDGVSDIAWYRPGGRATTMWVWRRGLRSYAVQPFDAISGTYSPVVADLDGDRRDDIWFPTAGGTNRWLSRGTGWAKSPTGYVLTAADVLVRRDGRPWAVAELFSGRVVLNQRHP